MSDSAEPGGGGMLGKATRIVRDQKAESDQPVQSPPSHSVDAEERAERSARVLQSQLRPMQKEAQTKVEAAKKEEENPTQQPSGLKRTVLPGAPVRQSSTSS